MEIQIERLAELVESHLEGVGDGNPLYIKFGASKRAVDRTEVYPTLSGLEIALDFNEEGVVIGIEFV